MFKKLKEKITEEVRQSPSRISASVSQFSQAVVSPSSSSIFEPTTVTDNHFTISDDVEDAWRAGTPPRGFTSVELQSEAVPSVPSTANRSRHSSFSSVVSDAFPFFESTPFNSSFHIQSDVESASEFEDSFSSQLPTSSKEQLVNVLRKTQQRYNKYKGRYTDLARHYRELERDNVKAKTVLSESQDKALRRIAELKEQCALEQRAKAHLEEVLRNDLEEKDHLILTLNTKIDLLKLNDNAEEFNTSVDSFAEANQTKEAPQSPVGDTLIDTSSETSKDTADSNVSAEHSEHLLRDKVQKLELLLVRCKDSIKLHKDKVKEFSTENDELRHKVDSQAQCFAELAQARDVIVSLRQRDEEAALSLAETKRSIHSEMELKEEQVKHLRQTINTLNEQRDETSRKCLQLQNQLQELDIKADKSKQIQELAQVKQEAVRLMQLETAQRLTAMQDEMAMKEQHFQALLKESANEKDQLLNTVSALQTQLKCVEEDRVKVEESVKSLECSNGELEAKTKQLHESCIVLQEQIVQAEANATHLYEVRVGLEKQLLEVKNANDLIIEERDANIAQAFQLRNREVVYQYSLLEELSRRINSPYYDANSSSDVSATNSAFLKENHGSLPGEMGSDSQLSPPLNELENSECDQHMELDRHGPQVMRSLFALPHEANNSAGIVIEPEAEQGTLLLKVATEEDSEGHSQALKRLNEAKKILAAALEKRDRIVRECQREVTVLKNEISKLQSLPAQGSLSGTTDNDKNMLYVDDLKKLHLSNVEKLKAEFEILQGVCLNYKIVLQQMKDEIADMKMKNETGLKQVEQECTVRLKENECKYNASMLSLESEMQLLKSKLEADASKYDSKVTEHQELLEKFSTLNEQLSKVTEEHSHLVEEISLLKADMGQNEEAAFKQIEQIKQSSAELLKETESKYNASMLSLESEMQLLKSKSEADAAKYDSKVTEHQELLEKFSALNEQLSKVTEEHSHLVEEISLLKAKNAELTSTLETAAREVNEKEASHAEVVKRLSQMEDWPEKFSDVVMELNEVLAEKSALVDELDAKIKMESEMANSISSLQAKIKELKDAESKLKALQDSIGSEKDHVEAVALQLQESARLVEEKDDKLNKIEECHRLKIKQLAKDFDNKLHEREEELSKMHEDEKASVEKSEGVQLKQLRGQIKAMKSEERESNQLISDLREKIALLTEMKEQDQVQCEEQVRVVQSSHEQELSACDKKWRQCLDQELEARDAAHKEELNALLKEWDFERKELASTSHVAVAAVKSGTGSMELMHQQLVSMTHQIDQQRLELTALRQGHQSGHAGMEDGSTELEYLRNIVFQYMMGREPTVLAKVITAVLKFDPEQTDKVMQKEELKQSLLGQFHIR